MDAPLGWLFLCMQLGTLLQYGDQAFEVHPCTFGLDGQRILRSTTRRNKVKGPWASFATRSCRHSTGPATVLWLSKLLCSFKQ